MNREHEQLFVLDERTQQAIAELEQTIRGRYPSTNFELARSPEDQHSLHLTAIVDVDDPDEVGDLVLDRVLELVVEEGISLHVIPVRTPERISAAKHQRRIGRHRASPSRSSPGLLQQ